MYLGGVSCSNWWKALFLQHFTCSSACDRRPVGNAYRCPVIAMRFSGDLSDANGFSSTKLTRGLYVDE